MRLAAWCIVDLPWIEHAGTTIRSQKGKMMGENIVLGELGLNL
jgi:hypothetical protein